MDFYVVPGLVGVLVGVSPEHVVLDTVSILLRHGSSIVRECRVCVTGVDVERLVKLIRRRLGLRLVEWEEDKNTFVFERGNTRFNIYVHRDDVVIDVDHGKSRPPQPPYVSPWFGQHVSLGYRTARLLTKLSDLVYKMYCLLATWAKTLEVNEGYRALAKLVELAVSRHVNVSMWVFEHPFEVAKQLKRFFGKRLRLVHAIEYMYDDDIPRAMFLAKLDDHTIHMYARDKVGGGMVR